MKYIHKGFDCADLSITSEELNQDVKYLDHDEIKKFQDARYVSAPEATWRLLEMKMHLMSHNVERLSIHLPNMKPVYFE